VLRKDCGFVVDRAVLKLEHQVAGHPIATGDLDQVTIGEEFTLQTAERQKPVDQSLGAAHGYLRGKQHVRLEQSYAGQYDGNRFGSIHRHAPILQSKNDPVDTSTLSVDESELAPRALSLRPTGLCNCREREVIQARSLR
jgi:hypothetical protein